MNAHRSPRPRPPLPFALALGALAFAGGVLLAWQGLGEWQERTVGESAIRRGFDDLARRAGIQLLPGKSLPHLDTSSGETMFAGQAKSLGALTPAQAATWTAGISLERGGVLPGDAAPRDL